MFFETNRTNKTVQREFDSTEPQIYNNSDKDSSLFAWKKEREPEIEKREECYLKVKLKLLNYSNRTSEIINKGNSIRGPGKQFLFLCFVLRLSI